LPVKKIVLFLHSENNSDKLNYYSNEKNISALEQKKEKQTWIQGKNGYCKWPKGISIPSGKREEKAYGF